MNPSDLTDPAGRALTLDVLWTDARRGMSDVTAEPFGCGSRKLRVVALIVDVHPPQLSICCRR